MDCHGMPWDCHETIMGPWRGTVIVSWHCNGTSIGYHGTAMVFPWDFHGSVDCLGTTIGLPRDTAKGHGHGTAIVSWECY